MLSPLPLLILQAAVIILVARLVGLVARRLGQPAVIAEVIAGVLLGPSLLDRVSPSLAVALFPKSSLAGLSLLSQVGLLFFMFLIGLELDPKLLRGRGASTFAISAAGIFVPFSLGALLALRIFGSHAEAGVPRASFMLFMGIAMSVTAFPVLARILSETKLIRTRLGSIALACAAADDVTAWCLLAFVVSFVHAKQPLAALFTTALAVGFAGCMMLVVRPLLARLAARTSKRESLTQNVVALTFVLLLGSALVTEMIGIHALFGAFLFGAIMPRQGDYAQALAERLEDFVVVALLPLFFAYSGLRTELGLINGLQDVLLCLSFIAVACLGKFGGSFSVARLTGMSTRDSVALGVLMNTRGLMELIVLNIGLDLGVISPKIFTMMVIMALVTTIMTTPLLEFVSPRAKLRAEASPRRSPTNRAARLLLCAGEASMVSAMARLALSCAGGAGPSESVALRLQPSGDRASKHLDATLRGAEADIEGRALPPETESETGVKTEAPSSESSDPVRDICDLAKANRSDYVVLGLRRPALGRNLFGGTVGAVLARASAPVALLIDNGLSRTFAPDSTCRRVLVALCGGRHDACVVDFGEQLLRDAAVSLSVLVVCADTAASGPLSRAGWLAAAYPTRVELRVEPSPARHESLLTAATRAELVIIGLEPVWGLTADGLDCEAVQLATACPASLLVLHERLGSSDPQELALDWDAAERGGSSATI